VTAFDNGEGVAIRAAEEASRRLRRVEFGIIVFVAVAAMAIGVATAWNTYRVRQFGQVIADCTTPGGRCYEQNRQAQMQFREDLRKLIRDVGQCQTLQLLQHRDANEKAHALNADKHGYHYMAPPTETPPPIPEELKRACDQFLTPAQGGTRD